MAKKNQRPMPPYVLAPRQRIAELMDDLRNATTDAYQAAQRCREFPICVAHKLEAAIEDINDVVQEMQEDNTDGN